MAPKKAAKKAAKSAKSAKSGKSTRPATRKSARPATKKAASAQRPRAATASRKKDGRPTAPWWPALSPYLVVSDGQAAIEFYARAFGFESYGEVMRGEDGSVQHAGMRLGEAAIMFGPHGMSDDMKPPAQSGNADNLSLYVYVPDVDALYARAQRAGAQVLKAPSDQFWGDRVTLIKDPDGYHWTFATNVKTTPH